MIGGETVLAELSVAKSNAKAATKSVAKKTIDKK